MKKFISIALFLLFANIAVAQVIGGSGVCACSGDPNLIAELQTQDERTDCLITHDTTSNKYYYWIDSNAPGSKWVNNLIVRKDTLYGIDSGFVHISNTGDTATIIINIPPPPAPQTLGWNGGTGVIDISDGNSIDIDGRYLQSEVDGDPNNEIQDITVHELVGNLLRLAITGQTVKQIDLSATYVTRTELLDSLSGLGSGGGNVYRAGAFGINEIPFGNNDSTLVTSEFLTFNGTFFQAPKARLTSELFIGPVGDSLVRVFDNGADQIGIDNIRGADFLFSSSGLNRFHIKTDGDGKLFGDDFILGNEFGAHARLQTDEMIIDDGIWPQYRNYINGANGHILWSKGGTDIMEFESDTDIRFYDRVGILKSPAYELDVDGNGIFQNSATGSYVFFNRGGTIELTGSTAAFATKLSSTASNTFHISHSSSGSPKILEISAAGDYRYGLTAGRYFRIDETNGFMGTGFTADLPLHPIHVKSDVLTVGYLQGTSNTAEFRLGNATTDWRFYSSGNNFGIYNDQYNIYINDDNNIGLNTSTPEFGVEVNDTLYIRSVVLDSDGDVGALDQVLKAKADGSTNWADESGGGGGGGGDVYKSGTLTQNDYVKGFNDSTIVTTSVVSDDGTDLTISGKIGYNGLNPNASWGMFGVGGVRTYAPGLASYSSITGNGGLEMVNGSDSYNFTIAANRLYLNKNGTNFIEFENDRDVYFYNKVGIGATPGTGFNLDVTGDFKLRGNGFIDNDLTITEQLGLNGKSPNASYAIQADGHAIFWSGSNYSYLKANGELIFNTSGNTFQLINEGSIASMRWQGSNLLQFDASRLRMHQDLIGYEHAVFNNGAVAPSAAIGLAAYADDDTKNEWAFSAYNDSGADLFAVRGDNKVTGDWADEHNSITNHGLVSRSWIMPGFEADPHENNIFYRADQRFTLTATNTSNTNYNNWFSNSYPVGATDINASATSVISIEWANQGGFNSAGLTYPAGDIYIIVYTGSEIGAATGRMRADDNVWTNLTWEGAVMGPGDNWAGDESMFGTIYKFSVPGSDNYIVEIEMTLPNALATACRVLSIEYYPTRAENLQTPYVNKYMDQRTNNAFDLYDGNDKIIGLDPDGSDKLYVDGDVLFDNTTVPLFRWDKSVGRVGIGDYTPEFTLDVSSQSSTATAAFESTGSFMEMNFTGGGNTYAMIMGTDGLEWSGVGQTFFELYDNGNIGFGTSGPAQYELVIDDTLQIKNVLRDSDGAIGAAGEVLHTRADGTTYWDTDDTGGGGTTQEQVQDWVGTMVDGNTETLIDVTYDDANDEFDFVVDDDLALYDNTTSGFIDELEDDLTPVIAGDLKLNGNALFDEFTGGEAIAIGEVCTMDDVLTDGEFYLASVSTESLIKSMLVIALEVGADNTVSDFATYGKIGGFSGLIAGDVYYVSTSDGQISNSQPGSGQWARVVGYALSATELFFNPSSEWIKMP